MLLVWMALHLLLPQRYHHHHHRHCGGACWAAWSLQENQVRSVIPRPEKIPDNRHISQPIFPLWTLTLWSTQMLKPPCPGSALKADHSSRPIAQYLTFKTRSSSIPITTTTYSRIIIPGAVLLTDQNEKTPCLILTVFGKLPQKHEQKHELLFCVLPTL